jgi:hypothetical protein
LSLLLFMCSITIIDLWMLNHSCIPGMKLIWSWCLIFLICCWILSANILLTFLSIFMKDIGLYFSYLCWVLEWV